MAKKRSRKGRMTTIPFEGTLPLSTLADGALLSGGILAAAFDRDAYVISIDSTYALRGATAGEGPIQVGWSHSDLSDTEVDEKLEAENTVRGNIVANERAKRPVRKTAAFQVIAAEEVLNNGMPIRSRMGWVCHEDFVPRLWAKNFSGSTLTTGAVVQVIGNLYVRYF